MKLLSLFILLFASHECFAKVNQTVYLKVLGDPEMGRRLIEQLQNTVDCYEIGYPKFLQCNTFKKFEHDNQIQGDVRASGSSVLYQVNIKKRDGIWRFNLQIFKRHKDSIVRYANGGNFAPQEFPMYKNTKISDDVFFEHLVNTTKHYLFK